MFNAVTPSKGLLAIHKDRRMALPGILTRSTLDVPYDGGDLVLIDGYLIVDYTCAPPTPLPPLRTPHAPHCPLLLCELNPSLCAAVL